MWFIKYSIWSFLSHIFNLKKKHLKFVSIQCAESRAQNYEATGGSKPKQLFNFVYQQYRQPPFLPLSTEAVCARRVAHQISVDIIWFLKTMREHEHVCVAARFRGMGRVTAGGLWAGVVVIGREKRNHLKSQSISMRSMVAVNRFFTINPRTTSILDLLIWRFLRKWKVVVVVVAIKYVSQKIFDLLEFG